MQGAVLVAGTEDWRRDSPEVVWIGDAEFNHRILKKIQEMQFQETAET